MRRDNHPLSKTYEALIKAERLRAAQDPAALARRVARAAEEGETVRAELRVCQEQLAALITRVDTAAAIDPAAIDDLRGQVAQLAAKQERLAAEPRQLLEAAVHLLKDEFGRQWAQLQSQSDQVAGRLEEVQEGVVPTLEAIRNELDEVQRRAGELESRRQTEKQSLDEKLEHLNGALARAVLSTEEQQREQRNLLQEVAALRAAQQDSLRQVQRLGGLSEVLESVSERLANVEATRRSDADRLQAEVRSLQKGVELLRVERSEADATAAALSSAQVETLRADLEALGERQAAADEEHRQLRQHLEEQLEHQRLEVAAKTMRTVQDSVEASQAAQQGLVDRLTVIADAQSRSDRRLHDLLRALEPLQTGQTQSAGEIEALSARVAALAEAQPRQQELAEDLRRAQASAEDAQRRITEIDGAQASHAETLRRQMEELRKSLLEKVTSVQQLAEAAPRGRPATGKAATRRATGGDDLSPKVEMLGQQVEELRGSVLKKVGSLEEALAGPLRSAAEIKELRAQVAALAEVQARQRQLVESVERTQASAEEATRRIAAIDQTHASNDEGLRLQIEQLRESLLEKVGSVEASLAGPLQSVAAIDELRAQVAALAEVQAGQRQLVESVDRAQANQDRLRRQMDELREGLLGKVSSVEASQAGHVSAAREIEELRAQVSALADVQAQQRQLADSVERTQATAEDTARRTDAIDETHASEVALLRQQVSELQADRESSRDALAVVQSALTEQHELVTDIEALRTRMVALMKAQARQDELADAVSRAQNAADEAERRTAASEKAQSSTLATLRQQLDALQAETGGWRVTDVAAQSALARHEQTAGEIEALRTKLARMADAQQRQQQLLQDLLVGPAKSKASRPLATGSEGSADLASLRRQVAALQADRLKLDAFLESRFELVCELLDAELQAKVEELRGGARGPVDLERVARKILPDALLRGASSIAGLRKKSR